MINQLPFVGVEFVDNPEPRCPCVLLLDTSGSMRGQAIAALNQGVELLAEELNADPLARERIELAVITFGDEVQVIQDFVSPAAFMPPRFEADGNTPMGRAVCFERAYLWDAETGGDIRVEVMVYEAVAYEAGVRLTQLIRRKAV